MDFMLHVGPWIWPLFATIFLLVCAWFSVDDRPTTGYGHIGKGLGNALIGLLYMLAIALVWIIYLVARLWTP